MLTTLLVSGRTLSTMTQLKRFAHFINADDRDENVVFVVDGREQHRPATFTEKHPEAHYFEASGRRHHSRRICLRETTS